MFLSDLLENESNIVRLYRGDAEEIDVFDANKNRRGIGLLFGHGVYLTNNKNVANEYTLSGARDKVILNTGRETRDEAIRDYIGYVIDKKLDKAERLEVIKQDILNRYRINELKRFTDEYDEMRKTMEKEFRDTWKKEFRKIVNQAKALIKSSIADIKLVETGQGWQFVVDNHTGYVTEFHLPQSYVAATLHGDEPLSGGALKIISEVFYEAFQDRKGDFRDPEGEFMQFDRWVEVFREKGSQYAWRDSNIGGKGENPSLDEIFNGTHGGLGFLYDDVKWDKVIARLQAAGYTGIQYYGGIRVADKLRGGGATKHTAFVFWDADYLNTCKVSREVGSLTGHDIDLSVAKPSKLNSWGRHDA